ncbi:MAG TPA: hypothetical protein VKA67_03075, partial [Verrucomicrobiae bacterium]|nr:hypothetical protein [Verrucomicrobiae bacterium]
FRAVGLGHTRFGFLCTPPDATLKTIVVFFATGAGNLPAPVSHLETALRVKMALAPANQG